MEINSNSLGIVVSDFNRAMTPVLGLPVLVRTLKVLYRAGVHVVCFDSSFEQEVIKLKFFKNIPKIFLGNPNVCQRVLSADYHYEPALLKEWLQRPLSSGCYVPTSEANGLWHSLDAIDAVKNIDHKLFQNIFNHTEGWIARGLNKKISFAMTRQLVKTAITPNQITIANIFLSFFAALCIASLDYPTRFLGAFLLQMTSVIDGCDGEVARLKLQYSTFGGWLDTIADDLGNNSFVIGLSFGLYRTMHRTEFLIVGGVILLMSCFVSFFIYRQLLAKKESANAKDFKPVWSSSDANKKSWFDYVRPLMKRDFFIFFLMVWIMLDCRLFLFFMMALMTTITFLLYFISTLIEWKRKSTY